MGWTLTSFKALHSPERIAQALEDQRAWVPQSHSQMLEWFALAWAENPRTAIRQARIMCGMAGFKSYADTYILMAHALGKL